MSKIESKQGVRARASKSRPAREDGSHKRKRRSKKRGREERRERDEEGDHATR